MLKLIYGKCGTGKSAYLYQEIKNNLKKEILIVPEQSNLKAEQKLFDVLKTSSIFNVQVLTLSRASDRILEEVGGNDFVTLSNSSKAMIIYDILNKEKDNLNFLGKSDKNIEIVSNMITELKKHNITLETLENTKTDDKITDLKLQDMKLIYKKYQEKIQNNWIDENDILTLVAPKILESNIFKNSNVYIDDFLGFTPQEYVFFENVLKEAENVTIAISADNLVCKEKENDIFYFNKIFANKLIEIAKRNNVQVQKVFLDENLKHKAEDLIYLENAFSLNAFIKPYEKEIRQYKYVFSK